MNSDSNLQIKLDKFAKYAWFVLAYNICVILWGVVVRASLSGDGCGQFWLTCGGEIVPSAPELKTIIEFSHRITSGLALVAVFVMFIWASRKYTKSSLMRKMAFSNRRPAGAGAGTRQRTESRCSGSRNCSFRKIYSFLRYRDDSRSLSPKKFSVAQSARYSSSN